MEEDEFSEQNFCHNSRYREKQSLKEHMDLRGIFE